MSVVVTSEQMKRLDNLTITEFGIPSRLLMEIAGKGCADFLQDNFEDMLSEGVVVLCGPGNNGGDGYVVARWLNYYGHEVTIIKIGEGNSSSETTDNRELCEKLQARFILPHDNDYKEASEAALNEAGVIIDAIYGIGFKGELKGPVAELIESVNEIPALKVALDMPSGVNADTGYAKLAFRADITLTMETLKFGHLIGRGKLHSGMVEVVPIGIPLQLWNNENVAYLLDETNTTLPDRDKYAHKGDYGRIAVFAGSPGYTGAAFMASLAALKAGAGLVTIYCHPENLVYYNEKPYEVMVKPVPVKADGTIDIDVLSDELKKSDVLLLGPGCGVSDYTHDLLSFTVNNWSKPAVIDADGLNTLAQHPELLAGLQNKPVVLTPHWGEFCRLAKLEMDVLEKDCLSALHDFVQKHKVKVLLKSHTSIYYDNVIMYLNTTGNDGLATGGSGDVLSGLIAGFLAQQMPISEASGMAAYYLGLTAEQLAEQQETLSITPSDILNHIFHYEDADEDIEHE